MAAVRSHQPTLITDIACRGRQIAVLDFQLAILPYFEEHYRPPQGTDGQGLSGWSNEFAPARQPDLLSTALATDALRSVTRLLDEGINTIILDHFSVKYLRSGARLG